jgi:hypothetical protein
MIIEGQYIRIILSPNLVAYSCIVFLSGGLDVSSSVLALMADLVV